MRRARLNLLVAVTGILTACFWSGVAAAALKVSLVTVAPGPVIFESFGHSAIVVEETDVAGKVAVYEYGNVNPSKLFSRPEVMEAFQELFESKVKTSATRISSDLPADSRIPTVLRDRYASNAKSYREVIVSELSLSEEQAAKLMALMEEDLAAGPYFYDNFKDNCATRPRDRLFDEAVIGKEARQAFDAKVDVTREAIVIESVDEAIALSPEKTISLMAPNFARTTKGRQALGVLRMIGIPGQFTSAKSFYEAVKKGDESITSFMPDSPLAGSFHDYFFNAEMTASPQEEYKTLFTPKRLRAALMKTVNPATGQPVLDSAREERTSPPPVLPAPVKN